MTTYITQEQAIELAVAAGLGRTLKPIGLDTGNVLYCTEGYRTNEVMELCNAAIQAYRDSLVAGVVLPEPQAWKYTSKYCGDKLFFTSCESELITTKTENATPLYTADQLRQAIADALAKQVTRAPMFEFRECEDSQAASPDPKDGLIPDHIKYPVDTPFVPYNPFPIKDPKEAV